MSIQSASQPPVLRNGGAVAESAQAIPALIPLASAQAHFDSLAELSRAVGGKAAVLSRLHALDIAVPPGLALSVAAFDAFAELHAVEALLEQWPRDVSDPSSFERAAQAVSERLRDATVGSSLADALRRALELMRDGADDVSWPHRRWAVRSSAVGEDSDADSFAGQLVSVLDVETHAVPRAVIDCWRSYWSAPVLFYQAARGKSLRGMGVLIQPMIVPRRGGVCFTESPAPGAAGRARIEFVEGHPEGLVSGRDTPQVLEYEREAGVLDARFSALVATTRHVARALGAPQDIEWLIDERERVWIVQSRPITTRAAPPAEAPARRQAFSNVNVNENYPRPMSVLLYSIACESYERYFHELGLRLGVGAERLDSVAPLLRHTVGAHGAHLYYNLTNIHACIQAAPFGDELARVFDIFVGVDDEGRTLPKAREPVARATSGTSRVRRVQELPALLRSIAASARSLATVPRRVSRFEARVDGYVLRSTRLDGLSVAELFQLFQDFIAVRLLEWSDAALADLSAAVGYAALKELLRATLGDQAANELPQTLLLAIPDVVSTAPVHALWALARVARETPELGRTLREQGAESLYQALERGSFPDFKRAFDDYVTRFGFRVSGELMLTTLSYVEQPARLLEVLVPYLDLAGPSPEVTTDKQARQRATATRDVRARLRWHTRTAFDAALAAAHAGIRLRERARFKQAHLYCNFRRVVAALGARLEQQGRLENAGDLLFLRWREIDDWLSGHELLPQAVEPLVALRRRAYAEQAASGKPAPTVCVPIGDYLIPAGSADDARAAGSTLHGLGVAGGNARGRARVLHHAHEQGQFQSGECLVAVQTDPGWAPLFFRAAGLVTERGGMLSHGAIVAREFGIPAVVAAHGATEILRSGELVEIDGNAGFVRKLAASELTDAR